MKMEQTECSETLAYKIQTPGNYAEENIKKQTLSVTNLVSPIILILKFFLLLCMYGVT